MAWNWFRRSKRKLPIMTTCPNAECGDRKLDGIIAVSKEIVMENLGISGEMRLHPEAKLLYCRLCGCVWQRTFNTHLFKFDDEILGTFRKTNTSRGLQMS
jgi:hypothetical protein